MKHNEIVSEVKLLLTMFNQREVSFITRYSTSSVSRMANNKTIMFNDIKVAANLSHFEPHVRIINELRTVKGIPGMGGLNKRDAQYMKILRAVGTELQNVKEQYADIPPGDVRDAWNYCQRYDLNDFNFNLLKMENSDILILKGMLGLQ